MSLDRPLAFYTIGIAYYFHKNLDQTVRADQVAYTPSIPLLFSVFPYRPGDAATFNRGC